MNDDANMTRPDPVENWPPRDQDVGNREQGVDEQRKGDSTSANAGAPPPASASTNSGRDTVPRSVAENSPSKPNEKTSRR